MRIRLFFLCLAAFGIMKCILQSEEDKDHAQMDKIFILDRLTDMSVNRLSDSTLKKSDSVLFQRTLNELYK